jgi:hypothetical protein
MSLTVNEIAKFIPKKTLEEYEKAKRSKKVNFYDYPKMMVYAKTNGLSRLLKLSWDNYMDMLSEYHNLMNFYGMESEFDARCDVKPKKSKGDK